MEAEHCEGLAARRSFTTDNYRITTCPANEWAYVVQGRAPPSADMRCGRRVPRVEELMGDALAVEAGLTRPEIIAVVLYSGPMVPRLPADSCSSSGAASGH